ncbi:conserved Plasmodium protein, unknown function [Plasmodium knowlesi strain H]|uniref:TRAP-like protein n=3 Tax=Plasmodium knowlesi TaxID=5850 RepID=A0A5K1VU38_PLAKH|nr:TRAP-like protein [Plasmodium knowlesi strain H]OTN65555.1 Uncharacterized protein PKNOH_S110110700 [Plasmodium knowlesi]CAA9989724.1 TRAP-like protein [Plasmodium knowlesi strain H]SBO22878.1 conserved Plasmodium protein, unknown function [Plasmodium knowlesi strain H]SBO23023.1 conserved Plasmodium protein, unknown function [Plasmodium knowlesi strain H]VVS79198.1 TRAP-like protein [Plasmodium knowlesi strain H]|eukprot:XP_002260447.1 hypothetical protein, conserved in Plasmodium species [Plasmodium knowlesi strain H]
MNLLIVLSILGLLPLAFGDSSTKKNSGYESYLMDDFCVEMNIHVLVSAEERYDRQYSYLLARRIANIAFNLENTWNYFSYSFFDDKILYTDMRRMGYEYDMLETLTRFQKDHKQYSITEYKHSNVFASLKEYYEEYILNNPQMNFSKNVIIISKFFGEQELSEYSEEFINYIRDIRSKKLGIFFYSDNSEKSRERTFQISEMSYHKSSNAPLAYFFGNDVDIAATVSVERFCYALEYGGTCARYNDWSDWSGPCEFRKRQRTTPIKVTLEPYIINKDHYVAHCRSLFNYEVIIREDYRRECTNEIYECRGICDEGYMFKPRVVEHEILEKYVSCNDLPVCTHEQRLKNHHRIYKELTKMLNSYAEDLRDEEILERKQMNKPYKGEIGEEGAMPRIVKEAGEQLKEKTRSMIERQHLLIKNHKLLLQHIDQGDEVNIIDNFGKFTIVKKPALDTSKMEVDRNDHASSNAATVGEGTSNKENEKDQSDSNTVETANADIAGKIDGKKAAEGGKMENGKGDDENAKESINQETSLNSEKEKNMQNEEEQEEEKIVQEILKDNNLDKSDEMAKVHTIDTVATDGSTVEIDSPRLSNGANLPNVEAAESTIIEPIIIEQNDNIKSQIGGGKNYEVNSNDYVTSDNAGNAIYRGPMEDASQGHSGGYHNNSPVYKNTHNVRDELTDKREQELHEESAAQRRRSETGSDVESMEDKITHVIKDVEGAGTERTVAPKESAQKEITKHGGVEESANERSGEGANEQSDERAKEQSDERANEQSDERANERSDEYVREEANKISNNNDEATTRTYQVGVKTEMTTHQGGERGEDNTRYAGKEGNINDEGVVAGQSQHKQTKEVDLNGQVGDNGGEEHKRGNHDKSLGDFLIMNHIPNGSKEQYELPELESERKKSNEHTTELHGENYGRISGHDKQTHDTDGDIETTTQSHAVHEMEEKSEENNHLVESAIPDGTKTEEHHIASHSTDGNILQGEGIRADALHNEGQSKYQFQGKEESEHQSKQAKKEGEDGNSANVSKNHLVNADETSHISSRTISEHRNLEEDNEGKDFMRVQTGKEHLVIGNNGVGNHKVSSEFTGGEIISGDDTERGKVPEEEVNENQKPYKDIREHVGQTDMNDIHPAGKNDEESIVEDSNMNDPEELEERLIENRIINHNFGEHADAHNGEEVDEVPIEREQEEQITRGHTEGEELSGNHPIHNQAKEEIEEERRTSKEHVAEELGINHVHKEQDVQEESVKGKKKEDKTSLGGTELGESSKSDNLVDETEGRNELTDEVAPTHVVTNDADKVKGHHLVNPIVREHLNDVERGEAILGEAAREREFLDEIADDQKAEDKSKDEDVHGSANVAESIDVDTHKEIEKNKDMGENKQESNDISVITDVVKTKDAEKDKTNGERKEVAEIKGDHMDIVADINEGKHEVVDESDRNDVDKYADIGERMNVVQSEDEGEPKITKNTGDSADATEDTSKHDGIIGKGEIGERTDVDEHIDIGEHTEMGEHKKEGEQDEVGNYDEVAEVEGVKSEHIKGSTEEGETMKDTPIDSSRESKGTEKSEGFDINQNLHEDIVNPIDGIVGEEAKKEELEGANTHSAHNKKGEITPKEHEVVDNLDRNGENQEKVEDKNEQNLDYRIDDEKKANISPHVQTEVSKEKNEQVNEEVEDISTTNGKQESTGKVSSATKIDTDFTITQKKTSILPEEESEKIESKKEKIDTKNINEIIDNVVNTYDSKRTNSEKQDFVREKLGILEDFVESTKQVEGGENENPYKYYSDIKTVHKVFYKKDSQGKLENDKYLIVGQNNFIIDSDDTKMPFPPNMYKRVSEILKDQIQKDVMNTLNADEEARDEATEGQENGDGDGNDSAHENGSGNEGGDENGNQDGRRESKFQNSKTFMYGSATVFGGAVVIIVSMYIYRYAQNYGFTKKDNTNNIEYVFTSDVPMNEDKGQDIACGQSAYFEEGWS